MKNSNDIEYKLQQLSKINRIDDGGFSEQILTRIHAESERQREKSEVIVNAVMFLIVLCSAVWFVLAKVEIVELSICIATLMLTAMLKLEHQLGWDH